MLDFGSGDVSSSLTGRIRVIFIRFKPFQQQMYHRIQPVANKTRPQTKMTLNYRMARAHQKAFVAPKPHKSKSESRRGFCVHVVFGGVAEERQLESPDIRVALLNHPCDKVDLEEQLAHYIPVIVTVCATGWIVGILERIKHRFFG